MGCTGRSCLSIAFSMETLVCCPAWQLFSNDIEVLMSFEWAEFVWKKHSDDDSMPSTHPLLEVVFCKCQSWAGEMLDLLSHDVHLVAFMSAVSFMIHFALVAVVYLWSTLGQENLVVQWEWEGAAVLLQLLYRWISLGTPLWWHHKVRPGTRCFLHVQISKAG